MLQQETPEDFVIATGEQHSVRDFVEIAARHLDLKIKWEGQGLEEKGINAENGESIIKIDPRYFRPTEVDELLGDATKAKEKLGWTPKITFEELVTEMIDEDMKLAERDKLCQQEGYRIHRYFE